MSGHAAEETAVEPVKLSRRTCGLIRHREIAKGREHRQYLSVLSIGSAGSILSIGSAGSILTIGSSGSILCIGSAGSVLSIGGRKRDEPDEP